MKKQKLEKHGCSNIEELKDSQIESISGGYEVPVKFPPIFDPPIFELPPRPDYPFYPSPRPRLTIE